ncbi:ROK family protein [Muribacter muris]|uniref:ROK family protein n=1 Tax=Muribacter muris TaxID=67855 RepID=A0A4Y9JYZ2_9PAST|nr:ROK family protein [Muribacter muris]MBF0785396.1 ROK family protein [Muribacter muris]MBF0826050.1 ROK family protein [Muribacter muris]TFV09656.1 ROK family protein [Muribacter muris]
MSSNNPILSLNASERLLLRLIRQHSPSRAILSQLSGLTPGAITQYCRKLLFLGLIKENEKAVKKRGQTSYHLTLNPTACCSIGVTFLSEAFHLSLVDFCGNKLASECHTYQTKTDLDRLFSQIKSAIKRLLEKKFLQEARILGIGFSVSGYLLSDSSRSSPWFPLLQNQPHLADKLTQYLGYPCRIENNINTIAIGEYYSGAWRENDDLIVISLDFGIGAGVISQGKFIQGGFGNAGEVGMLFSYEQPRPSWNDLVKSLGKENITEADILARFDEQDPMLHHWLDRAKPQVLSLVISAIAWLDPKVIVITGMLPRPLIDHIATYIRHSSYFSQTERPLAQLDTTQIGIENIALGAAILPIYFLLNE